MGKNGLTVLVQGNVSENEYIRHCVGSSHVPMRLLPIERIETALARLAGGGVDAIVLNAPASNGSEQRDNLMKLRGAAPKVPIVVVHALLTGAAVTKALSAGAQGCLSREQCETDLSGTVISLVEKAKAQSAKPESRLVPDHRRAGRVAAFLGAKGGVGTTTVALNVACALARAATVILAELRPGLGTLSQYLHEVHAGPNVAGLLKLDADQLNPDQVNACLWPYKTIPGMSVLFAPQIAEELEPLTPRHAGTLAKFLSWVADYVIVDLPSGLTEANRNVIQGSDSLVVVVERVPSCVSAAKEVIKAIDAWNTKPKAIGAVLVNRTALGAPMELPEIAVKLGVPVLGVIPPAPDLCIAAENAGMPVLLFEPESLAAASLASMAEALATAA